MNVRQIVTGVACAAVLTVTSMSAVTAATTTVPAPIATKLAPKTTKHAAPDTTVQSSRMKRPVVAGNFCKKKLVRTTSKNAAGVLLTCKADAKGQVRWTK